MRWHGRRGRAERAPLDSALVSLVEGITGSDWLTNEPPQVVDFGIRS